MIRHQLARLIGRQRWLRSGVRFHLCKLVNNYETAAAVPFETDLYGLRYRGTLDNFIDWFVYYLGPYEEPELEVLASVLRGRDAPVFLDVGANVGHHTMALARYCGSVHAFEPYEPVRERLENHVEGNHLDNVVVHPVGLADTDREQTFFAPTSANSGQGTFKADANPTVSKAVSFPLPLLNGDRYLQGLGLKQVDLIRIDVEGMEREVLLGLEDTLHRYRPVVVLEVMPWNRADFATAEKLLALFPAGYGVRKIERRSLLHLFAPVRPHLVRANLEHSDANYLVAPLEFFEARETALHSAATTASRS